jgi:hypothetical protein
VFYRRRIAPLHLIGMGISYASVAGLWQIKLQGSEAAWGALWCFQCHRLCAVPVQRRDDKRLGSMRLVDLWPPAWPASLPAAVCFVAPHERRSGVAPR